MALWLKFESCGLELGGDTNLLFSYQLSVISYQRGHFRSNQSAFIF